MLKACLVEGKIMTKGKVQLVLLEERDAIDKYFECITACSWVGGEDAACVTRCVEVHLKDEPTD